ncbi:flocculation protein FLO11-like isoform X2 [Ischnura elegans]|uniref:flocculation protein FLO11-like isoform X2 n=1 Tax=Ischnura elegans TaxID=197161 RepID=UPI001ED8B791|nr:flocculation protein FLO11-like isoform X2 [Ischnura elegans]
MATGPPTASELRTCLCGTVVSGRKSAANGNVTSANTASSSSSSASAPVAGHGAHSEGCDGPSSHLRNAPGPPQTPQGPNPMSSSASSSSISVSNPSSSSSSMSGQKCRICRTKPKFLRGQRSLDLTTASNSSPVASKRPEQAASVSNIAASGGGEASSPMEDSSSGQGGSAHHQRTISQQPQRPAPTLRERRRARSAERYDGIRITRTDRGSSAIPRQSSVQPISGTNQNSGGGNSARRPDQPPEYSSTEPLSLPLLNSYHNLPPPTHSPPPSYEAAMSKSLLPPSYDEYLAQKMQGLGGIGSSTSSGPSSMAISHPSAGAPYAWRSCDHPGGSIMPPPPPFPVTTPSRYQQQSISRAVASSYEPNQGQQGQHCCTCSKCKVRKRHGMGTIMTTAEMTYYSHWKRKQQCKGSSQMV